MSERVSGEQAERASEAVSNLWRYYEEHAAQARQHETLRATVTSTLSGIAAAVIGFASLGGLTLSDVLPGLVVVAIGVLGGALSIKHYERNRLHTRILRAIREEIAALERDPGRQPSSTVGVRQKGERMHAEEFSLHKKKRDRTSDTARPASRWITVSLFQLWLGLNAILTIIGILVVVFSVVGIEAD